MEVSEAVNEVEKTLQQLEGVRFVHVHPKSRRVTVQWSEPATWEQIEKTLWRKQYQLNYL